MSGTGRFFQNLIFGLGINSTSLFKAATVKAATFLMVSVSLIWVSNRPGHISWLKLSKGMINNYKLVLEQNIHHLRDHQSNLFEFNSE